jgi:hypothetical protein
LFTLMIFDETYNLICVCVCVCVCVWVFIRGPFEEFVDWRQCAAVMQKEAVAVMPSCCGGCNVVVAWSSSL